MGCCFDTDTPHAAYNLDRTCVLAKHQAAAFTGMTRLQCHPFCEFQVTTYCLSCTTHVVSEEGSKSEENCNLRSAKAGHSSSICLSSPNAPILHHVVRKEGREIYSSLAASKADRME